MGQRIKELRMERGWTIEELAKRVNRNKSTLSDIENGKARAGRTLIESLCKEFNVTSDYLLRLSDDRQPSDNSIPTTTERGKRFVSEFMKLDEEQRIRVLEIVEEALESVKANKDN